jgi:NAD(P)-dependent dehydrogenase (short-subunit alcohol dehydrogenase family)
MSAAAWLVTGAGSGVGRALAIALASTGAEVLLAGRNRARLDETARWCWAPSQSFEVDLADPSSVAALVGSVAVHLGTRPLAGIVHAAGIMTWNSDATALGWSMVPLVNAVAPWRLTLALEPLLLAGTGARVLLVAGAPFTLRGLRPDADTWLGSHKGRGLALALEAAAGKVWLARSLHRRWAGRASAFAFHPGYVRSHLAGGLPLPFRALGLLAQPFLSKRSLTGEFLALDPAAPALSGTLVSGRRGIDNCPAAPDPEAEDAFALRLVSSPPTGR